MLYYRHSNIHISDLFQKVENQPLCRWLVVGDVGGVDGWWLVVLMVGGVDGWWLVVLVGGVDGWWCWLVVLMVGGVGGVDGC
jgi:hypothetical protein